MFSLVYYIIKMVEYTCFEPVRYRRRRNYPNNQSRFGEGVDIEVDVEMELPSSSQLDKPMVLMEIEIEINVTPWMYDLSQVVGQRNKHKYKHKRKNNQADVINATYDKMIRLLANALDDPLKKHQLKLLDDGFYFE